MKSFLKAIIISGFPGASSHNNYRDEKIERNGEVYSNYDSPYLFFVGDIEAILFNKISIPFRIDPDVENISLCDPWDGKIDTFDLVFIDEVAATKEKEISDLLGWKFSVVRIKNILEGWPGYTFIDTGLSLITVISERIFKTRFHEGGFAKDLEAQLILKTS